MIDQAAQLADWLYNIKDAAVLTGAGMSTESGLPDFRSNGGLWDNKDPTAISSPKAIENDFDTFVKFFQARISEVNKHEPHEGHRILARWEEKGYVRRVMTQNIDGYHTLAGSKDLIELHGTLSEIRCHNQKCGIKQSGISYLDDANRYCECGSKNRPSIVLFHENLSKDVFAAAEKLAKECKLFIVLGTSLQVYPVASLPEIAAKRGAKIVIVDYNPINKAHLTVKGSIKDFLVEVDIILRDYERV